MRRDRFLLALGLAGALAACHNNTPAPNNTPREDSSAQQRTEVAFVELQGYALRDSVRTDRVPTIIRSQEQFEGYFKPGKEASAAPDFGSHAVIAIILDETGIETTLQPETLTATPASLHLRCGVTIGKASTKAVQPFLLLMIGKHSDRSDLQATFDVR